MRWAAKITETSKLSIHVRKVVLAKTNYFLERLQETHEHTVASISTETLLSYASHVALPKPESAEESASAEQLSGFDNSIPQTAYHTNQR